LQSNTPTGNTSPAMGGDGIGVGDRVVGTQIPGVFTVLSRTGELVEVESERGLRMRVLVRGLRKLETETLPPKAA
jgi:hypothetical protein